MEIVSPLRRSFGPMSLFYGAGIASQIFKFALVVLLGAEAIFLSDVVVSNLLPTILEHQAGFLNLLALIIFTMPGVMLIAFPLAVLVGSYIVIMNRRQAAEFAIIAGTGLSSRSLVVLTVLVGLGALIVSNLISGFVEPLARYELSKTLFSVKNDALRDGRIPSGEFYQIGDYAIFASSGQINNTARNVFFHEQVDQETDRILMADHSVRLRQPEISGIGLLLQDVAVYELEANKSDQAANVSSDAKGPQKVSANGDEESNTKALRVAVSNRMFLQFEEGDLPSLRARETQSSQLTNLELLQSDPNDKWTVLTFTERLVRDLLSFLAPMIALLAVVMTTSRTYLIVMPAAGGIVLGAQFLGSFGVKSLIPLGLYGAVACLFLLTAVIAACLVLAILKREHGIIRPMGARV